MFEGKDVPKQPILGLTSPYMGIALDHSGPIHFWIVSPQFAQLNFGPVQGLTVYPTNEAIILFLPSPETCTRGHRLKL